MIYLTVTACIAVVALSAALIMVIRQAREERRDLEDRFLALTNLDAAILYKAQQDPEEATVSYVDEQREWELSPGGGGRG